MDLRRLALILLGVGAFLLVIGFGNWLANKPASEGGLAGGDLLSGSINSWGAQHAADYSTCLYSFDYPDRGIGTARTCESNPITPPALILGVLLLAGGGILFATRRA